MLIEFTRVPRVEGFGDDDEEHEGVQELHISINPENVAVVFAARTNGVCIVRMSDGRGFQVQGTYDEVMAAPLSSSDCSDTAVASRLMPTQTSALGVTAGETANRLHLKAHGH